MHSYGPVGIDHVDEEEITSPALLGSRIASDCERLLFPDLTIRDASVLLAVKEATIKAAGGQPPRFSWTQIEIVGRADSLDPWSRQMASLAGLENAVSWHVELHAALIRRHAGGDGSPEECGRATAVTGSRGAGLCAVVRIN